MEPNFKYKLIVGGGSPLHTFLPWPVGIAEKDYKVPELMEAILQQYSDQVECPDIVKLAVLVLQHSNSNAGALHVMAAYVGHVGPTWNEEMVGHVSLHSDFLFLSCGIDGHPKDAAWRKLKTMEFLNNRIQWIVLMDSFHQSKSLNMAALIASSPKRYGKGVVDPAIFSEVGVAKHHWTIRHVFSDARVDALSHSTVLSKVWQQSGQSLSGAATVLWHFYCRTLKFSTVKYAEKTLGGIHSLLSTHERLMLMAAGLHFYLNADGLHHITRANQVQCHISNMFFIAGEAVLNPHRGQSMMAECTIAQLRAFQKEFTVNDLIMCCSKLTHLLQACELGGLKCRGQPACVYGQFMEDAEQVVRDMVEKRSKNNVVLLDQKLSLHKAQHVDYGPAANVTQQLWTFVKPRLALVLRDGAVVERTHEWFKLPYSKPLRKVSTESLQAFAASVQDILNVDGAPDMGVAPGEENIDFDLDPEVPPQPEMDIAVAMATLAQDLPLQGDLVECQIEPATPDEVIFDGPGLEPQPVQGSTEVAGGRAEIVKALVAFTQPKSIHDMIESAIKLAALAMHSKTVSTSLPDRTHCSIEQRWMTVDRTLGPAVAHDSEHPPVGRYDVVRFKGQFWRIIATFAKYYNRWACTGEAVPLTDKHKLLLHGLTVSHKEYPYVKDNFQDPFLLIALASECTDMKYSLVKEEEYRYKQKKRKGEDLWVDL